MEVRGDLPKEIPEIEGQAKRQLKPRWGMLITVVAVFTSVFHLASSSVIILDPMVLRGATLGLGSLMAFIIFQGSKTSTKNRPSLVDYILCLATISVYLYILVDYENLIYRTGVAPTLLDLVFGAAMLVIVLEITRRTVGWVLTLFAATAIAYILWGWFLPGLLAHPPYSLSRTISYLFGLDSVYGTTLGVVSTYVILFVVFGSFMQANGTATLIVDLANAIAGRSRGGPAKVAVVASAFMGSISGSTIANVVTTGSFTIPMMKKIGYKPHFAAGVETAASSGGQIMPPVMGAGAFIMAELLGIPYSTIVVAAIIPALLYFTSILWQVDLEAQKEGLAGQDRRSLPELKNILTTRGYLLLPLIVLIYALLALKMSAQGAGILAIVSCVIVSWFRKDTRMGLKEILLALEQGGLGSITPIAATAAAGIVVGALSLTGLGVNLGISLLSFTGGNLILTLVFTALFAIILGCGQPSIAAYIIAAAVAVPSVVKLGVPALTAHLFVFYFASFSNVTPPVAVASYVAAGIAKAKPLATAKAGFILSISAFLVPFLFIFRPAILLGSDGNVLIAVLSCLLGLLALGSAAEGWLVSRLNWIERGALLAAAFLSLTPGWAGDVAGFIVLAGIWFLKAIQRHKKIERGIML